MNVSLKPSICHILTLLKRHWLPRTFSLIFISRVGSAGHISKYSGKCYITDLVGAYVVNDKLDVSQGFIYHYLKYKEDEIKKNNTMKTGAPSINLGNLLKNLMISMPLLENQKIIEKYCEDINHVIGLLKEQIINNEKLKIKIISEHLNNNMSNKSNNDSSDDSMHLYF